MGKPIPDLISILMPTTRKKQRHNFTAKAKSEAVLKQKGRCAICGTHMNRWERDFHHKDGNKTNDKFSNCRAVHTSCHRKKHAEKMNNKQRQALEFLLKTKKWNPYCIRHSAITSDSDYLPEYALKKKVRWSMNSKQGSRYIKRRMGNDLKNQILVHNAIITENLL